VVGRNGSGKTTLLRTLLGLLPAVSGSVKHERHDLRVTYLSQRAVVDELYPLLVGDVVAMGIERGWSFIGRRSAETTRRTRTALAEMGVERLHDEPFGRLSDGQKQRVLCARVAAADAELAVLDEPTSAMDFVAEREAFRLLSELRQSRQLAVVIASHFLGLAREFADGVVLLDRETPAIVVGKPSEVLAHRAFRDLYEPAEAKVEHG
jgi:ABC-type Mn2+/Zn2+ transport system ATPase subunit